MLAATVIFCLLACAIVLFELLRRRAIRYDFLFFFNISFLVYYALAPVHILIGGPDFAALPNVHREFFVDDAASTRMIWMAILAVIAFCATIGGFYAHGLSSANGLRFIAPSNQRTMLVIALCVGLGGASLTVYMAQFGSPLQAIVNATLLRSGAESVPGDVSFLRTLIPLASAGAPMLLAAWLAHESPNLDRHFRWLFLALLLIGIVVLASQGSRRVWMIYAMEFYFFLANARNRLYGMPLALVALSTLVLVVFGDVLVLGIALGEEFFSRGIYELATSNFRTMYALAWYDFSYTFQSMVAIIEKYDGLPRLFLDVPYVGLELLPERLMPLDLPPPIAVDSTLLITGIPVPLINEVPPGYVGFLWYSGFLPGIVVGGFLYGWIAGAIERFLLPEDGAHPIAVLVYTWAAFCFGYFLREGSPFMILTERFQWFIAALLLSLAGGFALHNRTSARQRFGPRQPGH